MSTWVDIDAYLQAQGVRIGAPTVGQTIGGVHATNSYHYKGLARDYGSASSDLAGVWQALLPFAKGPRDQLIELFGPWGSWKAGNEIWPVAGHDDHVHAAIRSEGLLGASQSNGGAVSDVPEHKRIVGFAVTPTGNGYWLVAADGAVYTFGDARYFGTVRWDGEKWVIA